MINKKLFNYYESSLNKTVINNFSKVNLSYLIPPFFVLLFCFLLFVFLNDQKNFIDGYVVIQKELFFFLNSKLSTFPNLQYNLTQLGDVIILFPFVSIFIIYAPKLWEAILCSSILSLVTSALLKKIFSIPRPAAILDNESFVIVGKVLKGHNSLPSGHSMTSFIVISLLMHAFVPKKNINKLFWFFFLFFFGFIITFSRVGVGAHYPLDVVIGSTIGYILAIFGIKLNAKLDWVKKIKIEKKGLLYILAMLIWMFLIIQKIVDKNLIIFYLSFVSLLITLFITYKRYVQFKN